MIKLEVLVRVFTCTLNYGFKAWILSISPMMGYSLLPTPFECYLGKFDIFQKYFVNSKLNYVLILYMPTGGLFSYLVGIGTTIFNLLTNILRYLYTLLSRTKGHFLKIVFHCRYLYIRVVTSESQRIKKILMNPRLEGRLTLIGLGVVSAHGISTLFVEPNQFFFDQGKRTFCAVLRVLS